MDNQELEHFVNDNYNKSISFENLIKVFSENNISATYILNPTFKFYFDMLANMKNYSDPLYCRHLYADLKILELTGKIFSHYQKHVNCEFVFAIDVIHHCKICHAQCRCYNESCKTCFWFNIHHECQCGIRFKGYSKFDFKPK